MDILLHLNFMVSPYNSLVLCQYLLTVLFRRTTNGIARSKIAASRFYDHRHCRTKVSEKAKNALVLVYLGRCMIFKLGLLECIYNDHISKC